MTQTLKRLLARLLFVPTLLWNMLLGRVLKIRNWWDAVDEHVILGALPFPSDARRLHALGVGAVVNTTEEYAGPRTVYQQLEMEQLRVPTIDFVPPSLEHVETAVQFMDQQIALGNKVYVHCKAGRGRSATVVLCWLIANRDMTPEQGQAHLISQRPHVNRGLAERQVVQDFHAGQQGISASETAT